VLETALSGGIRYTTVEEVTRFLAAKPSTSRNETDDLSGAIEASLTESGV